MKNQSCIIWEYLLRKGSNYITADSTIWDHGQSLSTPSPFPFECSQPHKLRENKYHKWEEKKWPWWYEVNFHTFNFQYSRRNQCTCVEIHFRFIKSYGFTSQFSWFYFLFGGTHLKKIYIYIYIVLC